MEEKPVLFRVESGVGVITLNRPERHNAMDDQMYALLDEYVRAANLDPAVRVLVLHGNGPSFCSGAAIGVGGFSEQRNATPEQNIRRPHAEERPAILLRHSDKVVIAAIHGYALGIGLSMALGCDLRLAATDARFGAVQIRRGIPSDGALSYTLPRALGLQRALYLMLTGETIDGLEAERRGLVLQAVPVERLMAEAMALAAKIAAGPTVAQSFIKRAAYKAETSNLEEANEYEILAVMRCFATEDFVEGIRSFKERREPVFRGR